MTDISSSKRTVPTAAHWGSYLARVSNGRIEALEPHPLDPAPSPIGSGMVDATSSNARVRQPMIRQGYLQNGPSHGNNRRGAEPFVPVTWEEASDLIVQALTSTKKNHGNEAIFAGSYGWASAGRFHYAQGQLQRFLNMFGGFSDHRNSYSYGAMEVILPHVIGDTLRWRPDVMTWDDMAEDTELFVAFGGIPTKNMQVNPGGLIQHNAPAAALKCAKAGVEFINIGPTQDDIEDDLNAHWISIRPNTDAAFMLGLCFVLIAEDLYDKDFVSRCCVGFDQFKKYVLGTEDGTPKTPAWAASICDCPAEEIEKLARKITAKRSVISMTWAVQRGDHGEQPPWLAAAIASMSGSLGKPGGGLGYGYGAVHAYGKHFARYRMASVYGPGENPIKKFIPVARIADALLNPGGPVNYNGMQLTYPDIHLIWWVGGNPFHHHQDLNKLIQAWQKPETIIVNEPFWTSTARHADIVLPSATTLERNDIAFGEGSIMAVQRAVPPIGESLTDYEIFSMLAEKLGFGQKFTENRDAMNWLEHMYETTRSNAEDLKLPPFSEFWSEGSVTVPAVSQPPPLFSEFRNDPAAHPLNTPSGKVELFSEVIDSFGYEDCPGHPTWIPPQEWLGSEKTASFPIHLSSNQPATRLHSQYDCGSHSRDSKVQGREPLIIHKDDAADRGIKDGDVVRVFNDRGAFLAGAVVSARIRPHVAQIATGAWYDPLEPGVIGTLDVHGNPNAVTADHGTSNLAQGCSSSSVLVEIERFDGPLPPIKVFDAPPTAQE